MLLCRKDLIGLAHMKTSVKHIIFLFLLTIVVARTSAQCTKRYDSVLHKTIYTKVDVMPEFPNGQTGFNRYLMKNLQAPEGTFEDCPGAGSIRYSFVIEANSLMTNITINNIKDTSDMCVFEKAFYYFLSKGPKWSAGKCGMKTVPVKMTFSACILLQ